MADEFDRMLNEANAKIKVAKRAPVAQAATFAGEAEAVGSGFNEGLAEVLGLPVDIVTGAINLVASPFTDEAIDPDTFGGSKSFKRGFETLGAPTDIEAKTATGRFARRAAEFAGGSAVPLLGLAGKATALAKSANPAIAALGQSLLQTPGKVVASEAIASVGAAAGGAIAEEVAPDSPTAQFVGELAGAMTPAGLAAIGRRALGGPKGTRLLEEEGLAASREAEEAATASERALGAEGTLLPAQKTGDPGLIETQTLLARLPDSSKTAASALKKQNKQVFDVVEEVINTVAPSSASPEAGGQVRTAAQRAIEARKQIRAAKSGKIYDEAFDAATESKLSVDVSPVVAVADDALTRFVPETSIGRSIAKVKKVIQESGNVGRVQTEGAVADTIIGSNLEALQGAKIDLDQAINVAITKGKRGQVRELVKIRNSLNDTLKQASPQYKAADARFAELTPAVTDLEQSAIGRISKMTDEQLDTVSQKLFSPTIANEGSIKRAREIIESVNPQAWKNIVRNEIERRLGAVVQKIDEGGFLKVENVPGQLKRALFGNAKARRNLLTALDKDTRNSFLHLEKILERAELGRLTGSTTAEKTAILERMNSLFGRIRALANPVKALSETGEQAIQGAGIREQARIFFDPNGFNSKVFQLQKEKSITVPQELIRAISALDDALTENNQ